MEVIGLQYLPIFIYKWHEQITYIIIICEI